MTGLPMWVYPVASAAGCCLLLAGLLWWGQRGPSIDLTDLTLDHELQPSDDEVEAASVRYTVDPAKFTTAEIQDLHRVRVQDYLDAEEIRKRMRWPL